MKQQIIMNNFYIKSNEVRIKSIKNQNDKVIVISNKKSKRKKGSEVIKRYGRGNMLHQRFLEHPKKVKRVRNN